MGQIYFDLILDVIGVDPDQELVIVIDKDHILVDHEVPISLYEFRAGRYDLLGKVKGYLIGV